ncbi:class I SAM-dependent methyltransferase [Streptomyces sp. NPDC001970]
MAETAPTEPTAVTGTDWRAWQESWDRQQEWYMPDREERFRVMLDMVEAVAGPEPRVLDLACGTGSITDRLLKRFPKAVGVGVDLDPALLAIALHWLRTGPLATLYGQVAGLVRDGGVFMNADHMRDDTTPRINAAERAHRHAGMDRAKAAGALDWADWWALAAKDPVLAGPTARRFEIYGEHADGDTPSLDWHAATLRAAGFAEARGVWASPSDSLVLALK